MPARFYVLEDDVPIATRSRSSQPRSPNGVDRLPFPFPGMLIGQSFLVPHNRRNSVNARCSQIKKELGWSFVVRTVEEGVRVWRVSGDYHD